MKVGGIVITIGTTFDPKGLSAGEKRLKKFGTAANLVLGGLAASAVAFAKAASEDAAQASTLAKTLQNVTGATTKQTAAVEDYISKLTLATGVADSELRPSLDRLVRATGSVTEAQKLQQLALDVSAGTGKELSAVTEALAKAQEGNFTSLSRLGAGLDKATIASGDLDTITATLAATFSGQAEVAANTSEGQFKRLQVALSETQEEIGGALLPIIQKFIPVIQRLAKFIMENTKLVLILAGVMGGLAVTVKIVQVAFAIYSNWAQILAAKTAILTKSQAALNLVMSLNPVALVVIAVVALVAALVLAYKKSETFRKIVDGAFTWIKEKAGELLDFFKKIPEFFVNTAKTLANLITTPYRLAFAGIAKLWNATIGGFKFSLPDWIPLVGGKSFSIPKLPEGIPALASGGIVTKPTIALIGEAGAEAVVPLSRGNNFNGQTVININGTVLDPEGTARALERVLRTSKLRGGAYA
jgi:hypothetical protein